MHCYDYSLSTIIIVDKHKVTEFLHAYIGLLLTVDFNNLPKNNTEFFNSFYMQIISSHSLPHHQLQKVFLVT